LKRVNGVGSGDILGTREYAMRIWLKPDRMLAYKISTDEVMEALSSQSLEASPGKTGKRLVSVHKHLNMYLNIQVDFTTEKQYANIILRSNPDGEILRLKDVANIEFGSSMYDIYSNLNGKPSAAIVLNLW
jgi:HAE1 family hydrophobic/amphiphilic exporter-1